MAERASARDRFRLPRWGQRGTAGAAIPAQLAFEIYAMLETADSMYQLSDDPQALERGRSGVKARLERAKIGA